MDWYNALKLFHVLSAIVMIGVPTVSAWILFVVRHQSNLFSLHQTQQRLLKLNAWLVCALAFLQPITGFGMVFSHENRFSWQWTAGALMAYIFAVSLWFAYLFLQAKSIELIQVAIESASILCINYHRTVSMRIITGVFCLATVLMAILIMTSKV